MRECCIIAIAMTAGRFFAFIIGVFMFTGLTAQTETIYQFDEEDLHSINANTLADIIAFMPLMNSYEQRMDQVSKLEGAVDITSCAIFLDGMPMFMDQNIEVDLHAISMQDVVRVELKFPKVESLTKGLHTVNIYLYTKKIDDSPSNVKLLGSLATNKDALLAVNSSFSNKKHSFGLSFSRYFENATISDSLERLHELPSFTNQKVRLNYKYKFFGDASMGLRYGLRSHNMIRRNALFEGTTRSTDYNEEDLVQRMGLDLYLPLSRTHTLKFIGQLMHDKHYHYTSERDLYTFRNDRLRVNSLEDSSNHRHILLATSFSKRDSNQNFGYSLGIQYSQFKDEFVPTIRAIPLSYSDYVLSASFDVKPSDIVFVEGGIHFLSNSLFGFNVLPRARVSIMPSNKLELVFNHTNSVNYPYYAAVFYPAAERNSGFENNLNMDASRVSISQMLLQLKGEKVNFTSGILYSSFSKLLRQNNELHTYTSTGDANSLTTFFGLNVKTDDLKLHPVFAIIGHNAVKDLVDQTFYVPEFTMNASYKSPLLGLRMNAMLKVAGVSNSISLDGEDFLQEQVDPLHRINLSLSRSFSEDKLTVYIGVRNLSNQYNLPHVAYLLNDFEQTVEATYLSYVSRPRSFFIRLAVDLE